MRVVHVNTERGYRGGENQVFNLMLGLRERGHAAEVVALPGGALADRCRGAGLTVHPLAMASDADLPAAWRLRQILRRIHPAIVHAQTARAHSLAMLARALGSPAPLVVSRRIDFPVRRDPFNLWKYRSRLVTHYVAVAEVIRDVLTTAGVAPERISVIHSSIDLERFTDRGIDRAATRRELGLAPDDVVIGNVAALAWHKGQKDLVAAFARLATAAPKARLVIVGSGEEDAALKRQVAGLALEGRVLFTGQRNDVPKILSAFDFFCMPSYKEGLCNSVLEAFAMRLPVVAARAGGLPEIVEEGRTGLLAPPAEPEALAAALSRLMHDRALAERVAEGGRRLVHERFGVDRMVERTIELYGRLAPGAQA